MPIEFVIDLVEPQKDITYVMGLSLQTLRVGDSFTHLCVYQPPAKRNQAPKLEQKLALAVTVISIVVQGEPLENLTAESSAQIGIEGDVTALISLLDAHKWHLKNGRYMLPHQESRIITVSGD